MSRVCELSGKSPQTGNNVSHAKIEPKRRFLPNLNEWTLIKRYAGSFIQIPHLWHLHCVLLITWWLDAYLAKAKDALNCQQKR
ncbi:UNVERIFIED_CONTAM: hypothetical protein GTU68_020290 [Idotea baltica]|nr:hypothetical protein [Idotea baltica]